MPPRPWEREPISGSIEAGKLADLVVVSGDPLADIKNARKVGLVIENGEVYGLADLLKRVPRRRISCRDSQHVTSV